MLLIAIFNFHYQTFFGMSCREWEAYITIFIHFIIILPSKYLKIWNMSCINYIVSSNQRIVISPRDVVVKDFGYFSHCT